MYIPPSSPSYAVPGKHDILSFLSQCTVYRRHAYVLNRFPDTTYTSVHSRCRCRFDAPIWTRPTLKSPTLSYYFRHLSDSFFALLRFHKLLPLSGHLKVILSPRGKYAATYTTTPQSSIVSLLIPLLHFGLKPSAPLRFHHNLLILLVIEGNVTSFSKLAT